MVFTNHRLKCKLFVSTFMLRHSRLQKKKHRKKKNKRNRPELRGFLRLLTSPKINLELSYRLSYSSANLLRILSKLRKTKSFPYNYIETPVQILRNSYKVYAILSITKISMEFCLTPSIVVVISFCLCRLFQPSVII